MLGFKSKPEWWASFEQRLAALPGIRGAGYDGVVNDDVHGYHLVLDRNVSFHDVNTPAFQDVIFDMWQRGITLQMSRSR